MRNAREHAENTDRLWQGMRTDGEHGVYLLQSMARDVIIDALTGAQEVAQKVMQSPRTEILNIQPGEAKVMTPMDCWVKACQAIIQRIETMKGAQ